MCRNNLEMKLNSHTVFPSKTWTSFKNKSDFVQWFNFLIFHLIHDKLNNFVLGNLTLAIRCRILWYWKTNKKFYVESEEISNLSRFIHRKYFITLNAQQLLNMGCHMTIWIQALVKFYFHFSWMWKW